MTQHFHTVQERSLEEASVRFEKKIKHRFAICIRKCCNKCENVSMWAYSFVNIKQWNDRENCIYCRQSDLLGPFCVAGSFSLSPSALLLLRLLFLSTLFGFSSYSSILSLLGPLSIQFRLHDKKSKKDPKRCLCFNLNGNLLYMLCASDIEIQRNGRDEHTSSKNIATKPLFYAISIYMSHNASTNSNSKKNQHQPNEWA